MSGGYNGFPMREALRLTRDKPMTKPSGSEAKTPFEVRECKHGVEISSTFQPKLFELLTVEEAEDLAHQLLDAAREHRMNAEDYEDIHDDPAYREYVAAKMAGELDR